MAAFATFAEAEARAVAKVTDHTWNNAFACRKEDGTIAVRVQRLMSPTNPAYGAWEYITDNATT